MQMFLGTRIDFPQISLGSKCTRLPIGKWKMFGCHDSKTLSLPWRKKYILTFLFLSLNIIGIPVFSRAQSCHGSLGQLCYTFSHSNTSTSHLWCYGRTILNKHQQQSRYEKTSSSKKVSATGLAHKLNRGSHSFTRDSFSLRALFLKFFFFHTGSFTNSQHPPTLEKLSYIQCVSLLFHLHIL